MKSLYGLKQALKQWQEKFDNVMMSQGFKINECNKCVYVKDIEHGFVIVCLYLDDMLIVGNDDKVNISTKNMLNSRFDMKDMGSANVILGITIIRKSYELILSQSHYVDNILGKFDKDNYESDKTPIDLTLHLSMNVATPEPGPTRKANPNQNPVDARFISFIFRIIKFLFSKVSRPESPARPEWRIRTGARFTPTFSFILSKHFY